MYDDLSPQDKAKYVCALRAAEFVKSGMKVGLGQAARPIGWSNIWANRCAMGNWTSWRCQHQHAPKNRQLKRGSKLSPWMRLVGWMSLLMVQMNLTPIFLDQRGGGAHLQERLWPWHLIK